MGPDATTNATAFPRATHEARESSARARRAIEEQPTPERAVVVGIAGALETGARTTAAAFADAVEVTHGPQLEAAARAAQKTSDAPVSVVDHAEASRDELVTEVRRAWDEQPTIERKLVASAYEVLENTVEGGFRTGIAELGIAGAALEGVGEVIAANPANQLLVPWPVHLAKAAWADRDNRKAIVEHVSSSAVGIGGAIDTLHKSRGESIQRIGDDVAKQWERQPTIERKLLAANAEIQLGLVEAGAREVQRQVEVGLAVGEAAVNGVRTGVEVLGRTIGNLWDQLRGRK